VDDAPADPEEGRDEADAVGGAARERSAELVGGARRVGQPSLAASVLARACRLRPAEKPDGTKRQHHGRGEIEGASPDVLDDDRADDRAGQRRCAEHEPAADVDPVVGA